VVRRKAFGNWSVRGLSVLSGLLFIVSAEALFLDGCELFYIDVQTSIALYMNLVATKAETDIAEVGSVPREVKGVV
jgi:hypothetical protein